MPSRKVNKSEREASAEPTSLTQRQQQQASMYQHVAESSRARAWEMYLRGIPKTRIAEALGVNRATVARIINSYYAEIARERKAYDPARKLDAAVQRMRRVQEQAWADHDTDDAREQYVLNTCSAHAEHSGEDDADASSRKGRESTAAVRYQSQRSQYLRVILDAEKEIARLEGLYEGLLDSEGGVVIRLIREDGGHSTALSARQETIPAPQPGGDSDG